MFVVEKPGFFTTVQDEGRWGYQAYGVPVAGAMDRYAYCLANLLVGNKPNAAVLEMTMLGGTFRFKQDTYVAVCGADMQGKLNGTPIQNGSSFLAAAGSELTFQYAISGCRTYLAIYGGIDVPEILGSRSTYTRGKLGGVEGRALIEGDTLSAGSEYMWPAKLRSLPKEYIPHYSNKLVIRVLLGPQDDLFTEEGIATLFHNTYIISNEADRMGYRLEGARIEHKDKPDIVSDALCQGAIQVPGHGMPIVMMSDRQTTGGYTKIGTVIGVDLALLAQAKPGDEVQFVECTNEEAVKALEQEIGQISALKAMLEGQARQRGKVRYFNVKVQGQTFHVEVEER